MNAPLHPIDAEHCTPVLRPAPADSRIGWLLVIAAVCLFSIGFLGGIFANPAPVFRCAVQGEPA